MLSIRVRNCCVCSACASGPDAYAQHAHQGLTCMLSMRTSSLRVCSAWFVLCRDLYNEGPFEKWKTDVYAEHTHQFLTRMLSMRTSALRVCSACAPVPVAYTQLKHKGRGIIIIDANYCLKSSTEKKIFWPKLREKNLLKNRQSNGAYA